MSVIDATGEGDLCPHCCGEGQVFIGGEPKFCLPCEGTGLRMHILDEPGAPHDVLYR